MEDSGKGTSRPPSCVQFTLPSKLHTDMLERNPGTFPPGQHHENHDQCPSFHAWAPTCTLWQASWSLISWEVLAFVPANRRRTCRDWPLRSSSSVLSLSGILFKPRVLCSDAVGERASGCEALLRSPRLCQGLWGLEVSRNTLGFRDVLEKQMTMALTSVSPARAKSQ